LFPKINGIVLVPNAIDSDNFLEHPFIDLFKDFVQAAQNLVKIHGFLHQKLTSSLVSHKLATFKISYESAHITLRYVTFHISYVFYVF